MSKKQQPVKSKGPPPGMGQAPKVARGPPPGLGPAPIRNPGLGPAPIRKETPKEKKRQVEEEEQEEPRGESPEQDEEPEVASEPTYEKEEEKGDLVPPREEEKREKEEDKVELLPVPLRPDTGKKGKPIVLRANFFPLEHKGQAFLYDIQIESSPESKLMTSKLKRHFVLYAEKNLPEFRGLYPVFDGNALLFTARVIPAKKFPLTFQVTADILFEKKAREKKSGDSDKKFREPKIYTMTINPSGKGTGELDMSSLLKYIKREEKEIPRIPLQAIDVASRYNAHNKYFPIGRSIFYPEEEGFSIDLGNAATLLLGHFQTVRACQGGLMLNLDTTATACIEALPVPDYLRKKMGRFPEFPKDQRIVEKLLKGLLIQATHRGPAEEKKKLRIMAIGRVSAKQEMFERHKKKISVAAYFAEAYKPLRLPDWPTIKVGPKNSDYPMEVCRISAGQRPKGGLTPQQQAGMVNATCRTPADRMNDIYQCLPDESTPDPYMKAFGLKIQREMVKLTGRILPPPELKYLDEKSGQPVPVVPRFGSWQLKNLKFVNAKAIQSCPIIVFGAEREMPTQYAEAWIKRLAQTCGYKGLKWTAPIRVSRAENSDVGVNKVFSSLAALKPKPQIVFCFLKSSKELVYELIKKETETKYGILTQCVDYTKATNQKVGGPAYQANIALKMNAKLGGTHTIVNGKLPVVDEAPTLILGADVHHPPAGNRTATSIAAIVGSTNKYFTTYSTVIQEQGHRVEHISGMEKAARWHIENQKQLPQQIIMFRDGVGEGHFPEIVAREVQAIRRACFSIKPEYKPKLTFVIVQKRNHTRFFLEDPSLGDRDGRLPAGTVVDSTVVSNGYDMYLCSHAGLKGTSKPTHYHVLWDEIKIPSDKLNELIYALCHIYQRCTKSVSMPAPAYYAHLAAYRARLYRDEETFSESSSQDKDGVPQKPLPQLLVNMSHCLYYS